MSNSIHTLTIKGEIVALTGPVVMGIINTTPDSFFAESRRQQGEDVLRQAEKMIADGAAILDIGGQSTRPGAVVVGAEEELRRVLPAIEAIHKRWPKQAVSIDTFYGKVAAEAVAAGAGLVNDVSAGQLDETLLPTVAELKVPYVLMHMPPDMHSLPSYKNVVTDVLDFMIERMAACRALGINDVIVDPGFGFGKTAGHNFQLLKNLSAFGMLNAPVLVGLSRKRTIYQTLSTSPEDALNGTTVVNTIGLLNGASILRVHDVKEAVEAVKLVQAMRQA